MKSLEAKIDAKIEAAAALRALPAPSKDAKEPSVSGDGVLGSLVAASGYQRDSKHNSAAVAPADDQSDTDANDDEPAADDEQPAAHSEAFERHRSLKARRQPFMERRNCRVWFSDGIRSYEHFP